MSVENFKDYYPASSELKKVIDDQRQREASHPISLVGQLALNLAKEGGHGLREAVGNLMPSGTAQRFTPRDIIRMPYNVREKISDSLGAIGLGMAVCTIDDAIWNKSYNFDYGASIYNMGVNGTMFAELSVGNKEEEILDDKYKAMIDLAVSDKTLTLFFEDKNLDIMPNGLRYLLVNMQLLPIIRERIVPIYRPRAELLINKL